jgi:hypothetical protein
VGTSKDDHGQPRNVLLRARQNVDRSIDELIGVCKGIVADGLVNQQEADYLCSWLQANEHVRDTWPANVLRARIAEYLEDGYLDPDEKCELFEMLNHVAAKRESDSVVNLSTSLPFDSPLPDIIFHGWGYCLTGKFRTGKRQYCEQFIESLGGIIISMPRPSGCILVVGDMSSRDWIHSTHGRKIEAAVVLRSQGHPVSIIPEHHWFESLRRELNY